MSKRSVHEKRAGKRVKIEFRERLMLRSIKSGNARVAMTTWYNNADRIVAVLLYSAGSSETIHGDRGRAMCGTPMLGVGENGDVPSVFGRSAVVPLDLWAKVIAMRAKVDN